MASKQSGKEVGRKATRISVSFDPEQYEYLVAKAKERRVSIAWVVRDAVYQSFRAESPLFSSAEPNQKEL